MAPMEWERSQLKNPVGEQDTPGRVLFTKWRDRILYDLGWFKVYWLMAIAILVMAGVAGWWIYEKMPQGWAMTDPLRHLAVYGMIGLFIPVRIHLAMVPGLVISRDTKASLWQYLSLTAIGGDETTKAMFRFSINSGALPFAVVSTLETILYLAIIKADMGTTDYLFTVPVIFAVYFILGFALNGCGIIGALWKRGPMGVMIGVIVPYALGLLTAGPSFIGNFINSFGMVLLQPLGNHPVTILLAPENRMAFSGASFSRQGFIVGPGTDIINMLSMLIPVFILAGLVWMWLWTVLRHRLRYG